MTRRHRSEENTEGGFFGRWSKRKARSVQGSPDEQADNDDLSPGVHESGGVDPSPTEGRAPDGGMDMPDDTRQEREEQVKTDADMPDLESIDESTNMSDFFSPGVSERLRNLALRRLFHTSKFNVVDPLDDYNESFRDFELLGDLVTSDMRHRLEMDEQRQKEAQQAAADAESELEDRTTEPDGNPEQDDEEAEAEAEDVAADSRSTGASPVDVDEPDGEGDAESRNKT